MADRLTVKKTAKKWGLSERRVSLLCKQGRVKGAVLEGHRWMIPSDTEKPADDRVKTGKYTSKAVEELRPLPVGISDYRSAVSDYYYVDKTLLIRDFLDELAKVTLFTRPRRFGKTLNMDMLRVYFEKSEEDTSVWFKDKKIWKCGKKYQDYQGKYPVIFITFKDTKFSSWSDTLENIRTLFANEFERHRELADSDECTANEKEYYVRTVAGENGETELMRALAVLSKMLHSHYGIAPLIIIDEYDIPIQQGHLQGFYDEAVSFMRNLFSGGFKDNPHLSYGFMTGVLRVAKESIFSGLNNLRIDSVLEGKYSEYFGFTESEITEMAEYFHKEEKLDELRNWYDGYRFGHTDIYNPWSVINYFANDCTPRAYWVSTSSNDIIKEILAEADDELYENLTALLRGKTVPAVIDTDVVYPRVNENPFSVYSFLLVTGYLKALSVEYSPSDGYICDVSLPNREITYVYKKEILENLNGIIRQSTAFSVRESLYRGNSELLQKSLQKLLIQSVSYYDTAGELFYHGLVLGLTAIMDDTYEVTSNRESGNGRYDIQLKPKGHNFPGILIELKASKDSGSESLRKLAEEAVSQMTVREYDAAMRSAGIQTILKYGIAFSGKNVEIVVG